MNELENIKKTQEEILRRLTVMESYYVVEEGDEDEIVYEEPTTAEQECLTNNDVVNIIRHIDRIVK